jgi:hypothetical protein
MTMMQIPKRIVAEISTTWPPPDPNEPPGVARVAASRFERVIETNRDRGYALESWQLVATYCDGQLVETIIAVFVIPIERDRRDD